MQLLNIVFNVSEQMVLVDFRSFWGMPKLGSLFWIDWVSSVSISDKPISLNEKLGMFFNVLLISKHQDGSYICLLLFQLS